VWPVLPRDSARGRRDVERSWARRTGHADSQLRRAATSNSSSSAESRVAFLHDHTITCCFLVAKMVLHSVWFVASLSFSMNLLSFHVSIRGFGQSLSFRLHLRLGLSGSNQKLELRSKNSPEDLPKPPFHVSSGSVRTTFFLRRTIIAKTSLRFRKVVTIHRLLAKARRPTIG